ADIYSLGATFYFLLAGHSPFREGGAVVKLMRQQFGPPRPIREVRPDVPAGLAAVLDRMMAKDPADRYQTPAEVLQALAPRGGAPRPGAAAGGDAGRPARGGPPAGPGRGRRGGGPRLARAAGRARLGADAPASPRRGGDPLARLAASHGALPGRVRGNARL